MVGGFRDSFTKDDAKEDVLGYDDTAFYYFAISVMTSIALPWTMSIAYGLLHPTRQTQKDFPARSESGNIIRYCKTSGMVHKDELIRRNSNKAVAGGSLGRLLRWSAIFALWACIVAMVAQLGDEVEIKKFDPFEILGIAPSAENAEIKKAYRKLSLLYHPDKNTRDPLAASRFIQVTKAYRALTDDVARENFEKYGNPDGPQTTKVGIGLPRFLLDKENSLTNLCVFFAVVIFIVPVAFIYYFQRVKMYAGNGVPFETLQVLSYNIKESTRVRNCPELLAAGSESRRIRYRPTDASELEALLGGIVQHKKPVFSLPIVCKNQALIWAHMQRKHHLMSPSLASDCLELLRHSVMTTQAMIEVACMREWFATTQATIDFRRCLVQALDVQSWQLLQVPHVTGDMLYRFRQTNRANGGFDAIPTLTQFLDMGRENRKAFLSKLALQDEDSLLDIEECCAHISNIELSASVGVEDESEIVVGDIATVTVRMLRKSLKENEAVGPVHAPMFPDSKFEEWWLFLVDYGSSSSSGARIVNFERITHLDRCVVMELRFQVLKQGESTIVLHAVCDSYVGIDRKVELQFFAHSKEGVVRTYKVHKEDEDLDLEPTPFQQFFGSELPRQDESDDEDEASEHAEYRPPKRETDAADSFKETTPTTAEAAMPDECSGGDSSDSD